MIYIFTQAKNAIVPINYVVYISPEYPRYGSQECKYAVKTEIETLGAYETKERALEVLKELSEQISYGCFIYEMPDK